MQSFQGLLVIRTTGAGVATTAAATRKKFARSITLRDGSLRL